MSVEHSLLTGASLHEPKGVASAAANRVYVSDGLGSGSWTTIGNAVLSPAAKAFQNQLLYVVGDTAPGVGGQSLAINTWNGLTLNAALINEISGASLAFNAINLPTGTYWCEAAAEYYAQSTVGHNIAKLRLRNIVNSTTALVGMASGGGGNLAVGTVQVQTIVNLYGRFTLGAPASLQLQMYPTVTLGAGELHQNGNGTSSGESERHATVMIWKID